MDNISRHNDEIWQNIQNWQKKPVLRRIYKAFYELIAKHLSVGVNGHLVEIGSGIGTIKEIIPSCIRTDLFPNPWIDRIENAYKLSFSDTSVSNIIMFDVFHHLRYPGTAIKESHRVLKSSGRLIIFEPCLSLLGLFIFGMLHPEPLGLIQEIQWFAPLDWLPDNTTYYASQGNASRIFLGNRYRRFFTDWQLVEVKRLSAISYIATGGYSRPQLYPSAVLFIMKAIDYLCDLLPWLFATKLLVVLEKKTID